MKLCSILAVGIAVAIQVGCGAAGSAETAEKHPQKPREAWITLDGYMGPENVGVLMAYDRGYFADLNIETLVTHPSSPEGSIGYVANRTVEFGVAHQPQVAIERAKGVPIVAVGNVIPHPTAAMIWLKKSGIDGIADLKGRTIATSGLPFQEAFLRSLLRQVGLTLEDVEIQQLGYELVPALADGRVDAIFGSWNLEGAALRARGLEPVITRLQSLGIPAYDELVLISRTDQAREQPQLVRDIVSAIARGTAAAVEHPGNAVRVIEKSGEPDPEADRRTTEAELEATLPLLSETGYMDPGQAADFIDWMRAEGLIQRPLPPSQLLTNEYLGLDP